MGSSNSVNASSKEHTKNNKNKKTVFSFDGIVIMAGHILTGLTAIAYVLVLILFYNEGIVKLIEALAVPGVSIVIVSIFRYLYNAPRPYEVTGVKPMSNKKTKGKSMPSRHTFAIFIIAMTVFYYDYRIGILMLIAGATLGMLRVIERVHFVKDVVVGALLGVGFGLLYYVLP